MRIRGTRLLAVCGLVAAAVALDIQTAPPAAAHGVKPDYLAYCQARFGDRAIGGWSQRRNAYACSPDGSWNPSGTAPINLAEICDMQFKASGYHTHPGQQPGQGPLITCNGTKEGDKPKTAVAGRARPDFDKFCRDRYSNSTGAKWTRQAWSCILAGRDDPTSNRAISVDEVCEEQYPGSKKALVGSDHSGAPRWFCAGGAAAKAGPGKKPGMQVGKVTRVGPGLKNVPSSVKEIWARNRARTAKHCRGKYVLRPMSVAEQQATRRDMKALCPAVAKLTPTGRQYCADMPTPQFCVKWAPKLSSTDCICKLLDYKVLP